MVDSSTLTKVVEIGGPAVAIIFSLSLASILVFKYGINPGLASFASMVASHREAVIESRVAAEASRDAAEASKTSAERSVEAVNRLDRMAQSARRA